MKKKIVQLQDVGDVELIKHPRAKRIKISISSGNRVRVSIPPRVPFQYGYSFAQTHTNWIHQRLKPKTIIAHGDVIGRQHVVEFIDGHAIRTYVRNDIINVTKTPDIHAEDEVVQTAAMKAAIRALRKEAQLFLPTMVQQLAIIHDVHLGKIAFKSMRTRWGSCSEQGNLNFSVYIMQLPDELIEYILIHELAHIKEMNHSAKFWDIVAQTCPNYKELRHDLKQRPLHLVPNPLT